MPEIGRWFPLILNKLQICTDFFFRYEIQKMASLKELDAELLQSKPFSVVDGVDLRKLCQFMVPEKDIHEV